MRAIATGAALAFSTAAMAADYSGVLEKVKLPAGFRVCQLVVCRACDNLHIQLWNGRGIQDTAGAAGFTVITANTDHDEDKAFEAMQIMQSRSIESVIQVAAMPALCRRQGHFVRLGWLWSGRAAHGCLVPLREKRN